MKKVIIVLLISLIPFLLSFGQNTNKVDSLLNKLSSAKEDTVQVEILRRLFNPTVVNDLDLAFEYTDKAQQLSEKLPFDKGLAAA